MRDFCRFLIDASHRTRLQPLQEAVVFLLRGPLLAYFSRCSPAVTSRAFWGKTPETGAAESEASGAATCVFCKIIAGKDPKATLLYQDEDYGVFPDIHPASTHHYLVVPKKHVKNVKSLTHNDIPLGWASTGLLSRASPTCTCTLFHPWQTCPRWPVSSSCLVCHGSVWWRTPWPTWSVRDHQRPDHFEIYLIRVML
ncbi:uncharacterized protein LOC119466001 isoform X2 [Dermacentor silvarum]|uniref:uncharacterized protein LOC119466001 isoform X2 n=1 Tax=Dermacentor silvarum TaxID=543639 RepID=UPI002101BEDF|nr:uncharacterized protein LOC119466001 isoform X2 [Dermacentor silvarum]